MAKGQLLEDTFEKLVELGQSTAKNTVKSVVSTLNPFSSSSKAEVGKSAQFEKATGKNPELSKNKNHTPVDFEKLKKEKKRQEVLAEQDKKRKEEEKRKQQAYSNVPRGKARRSIFSQKKAAGQQHAETKPATGKQ
ncbi:MAG: hypothetical protein UR68_C0052G0002 [Candidatus Roizmanbacteria bacterium GW2011_GWA2_35_19]|uniref:Uncharacterized protein n=1 Tax=Candidatus Roizmanbacteria bacterium GW2011_GWA2_35_19 TaxID=1618478 RepID=A0A0G0BZZ5_9BACT|nr:MAG: hypothetical protein UR68_C0052G0002 [Candidatus Roizmanbacteria bacterium GW2011_GWA2_35_19]